MALALAAVDNVGERLLRSRINAVHSYKHKMCRTTVAYADHDEESRDFRPPVLILICPAPHRGVQPPLACPTNPPRTCPQPQPPHRPATKAPRSSCARAGHYHRTPQRPGPKPRSSPE